MKVVGVNGCKVYDLSSGKSFPKFLSESKKRALAKDDDYRRRLDLIQDFEMNTTAQCIRVSSDNEHIIVAGTYPPCVKCYTVSDMSMKFHRGLTCEVVDMEVLSSGYEKLVFLQADRTLNFHAPYGTHYSLRIPKFGRHLQYNSSNCDLYISSNGDEIYRLNLEAGQFREPLKLSSDGCNRMHMNPIHQLLGTGCERGICEFWDIRTRKSVSTLIIDQSIDITALKFDTDGLTLGIGTSNGNVFLYDIRSSKPLYNKEHQYGDKIVDVHFHNSTKHIISTDKKIIKIWERESTKLGKILTNIETSSDINEITFVKDKRGETGMIMAAGEQSKIMTYFVPQLGPAPRWCSFLESLTEELEETHQSTVYEDYKFLTRQDIDEIGASSLIGTPMLKSYMHGFFIDMKLYLKLRAVSKPFEYEEHRKQLIQRKIDMKRESRIAPRRRVKQSKSKDDDDDDDEIVIGRGKSVSVKMDPRFASKLEREEFQVNENSEDYRLRHPTLAADRNGLRTSSDTATLELGLRRRQLDDSDDDILEQSTKSNSKSVTFIPKGKVKGKERQYNVEDEYDRVDLDDSDEQLLKASKRKMKSVRSSAGNSSRPKQVTDRSIQRPRFTNMYES